MTLTLEKWPNGRWCAIRQIQAEIYNRERLGITVKKLGKHPWNYTIIQSYVSNLVGRGLVEAMKPQTVQKKGVELFYRVKA
jgi:hypothetical protein